MLSKDEVKQLQKEQNEQFLKYENESFKKVYQILKKEINDSLIGLAEDSVIKGSFIIDFPKIEGIEDKDIDINSNSKLYLDVCKKLNFIFAKEGYSIKGYPINNFRTLKDYSMVLQAEYELLVSDFNEKDESDIRNELKSLEAKNQTYTEHQYNKFDILAKESFKKNL